MNTIVSFKLAKLLKEKGFDEHCLQCYAEERLIDKMTGGDIFTGIYRLCTKSRFHKRYYSAPTIAEVVMWLYEKHDIWIVAFPTEQDWTFDIFKGLDCVKSESFFNSPKKAYEAAIEYALNNLI